MNRFDEYKEIYNDGRKTIFIHPYTQQVIVETIVGELRFSCSLLEDLKENTQLMNAGYKINQTIGRK